MTRRVLLLGLIGVMVAIPGLQFLRTRWDKGAQVEAALVDASRRSREAGGPIEVDLRSATAFGWDRLFVIGPYTPLREIETTLGVPIPQRRLHRIDSRDDVVLMLFLRGQELVADLAFRRHQADLLPLVRPQPYRPDEAVMSVDLSDSGEMIVRRAAG